VHPRGTGIPPGEGGHTGTPSKAGSLLQEASLTVGNSFNTYQGFLMILLGFLILFSILGIFPSFNADGQIGLLLVLTSLELLALGQFVGSQVTRSWLVLAFGIFCAAAGIFSCIVPGILSGIIPPLLGLQNIITGILLIGTQIVAPTCGSAPRRTSPPPVIATVPRPHGHRTYDRPASTRSHQSSSRTCSDGRLCHPPPSPRHTRGPLLMTVQHPAAGNSVVKELPFFRPSTLVFDQMIEMTLKRKESFCWKEVAMLFTGTHSWASLKNVLQRLAEW
jgi:hypothetical protein